MWLRSHGQLLPKNKLERVKSRLDLEWLTLEITPEYLKIMNLNDNEFTLDAYFKLIPDSVFASFIEHYCKIVELYADAILDDKHDSIHHEWDTIKDEFSTWSIANQQLQNRSMKHFFDILVSSFDESKQFNDNRLNNIKLKRFSGEFKKLSNRDKLYYNIKQFIFMVINPINISNLLSCRQLFNLNDQTLYNSLTMVNCPFRFNIALNKYYEYEESPVLCLFQDHLNDVFSPDVKSKMSIDKINAHITKTCKIYSTNLFIESHDNLFERKNREIKYKRETDSIPIKFNYNQSIDYGNVIPVMKNIYAIVYPPNFNPSYLYMKNCFNVISENENIDIGSDECKKYMGDESKVYKYQNELCNLPYYRLVIVTFNKVNITNKIIFFDIINALRDYDNKFFIDDFYSFYPFINNTSSRDNSMTSLTGNSISLYDNNIDNDRVYDKFNDIASMYKQIYSTSDIPGVLYTKDSTSQNDVVSCKVFKLKRYLPYSLFHHYKQYLRVLVNVATLCTNPDIVCQSDVICEIERIKYNETNDDEFNSKISKLANDLIKICCIDKFWGRVDANYSTFDRLRQVYLNDKFIDKQFTIDIFDFKKLFIKASIGGIPEANLNTTLLENNMHIEKIKSKFIYALNGLIFIMNQKCKITTNNTESKSSSFKINLKDFNFLKNTDVSIYESKSNNDVISLLGLRKDNFKISNCGNFALLKLSEDLILYFPIKVDDMNEHLNCLNSEDVPKHVILLTEWLNQL